MMQTKTYDFKNKIAGSVVENPAIGKLDDMEFTQAQYNSIYGVSLGVVEPNILMEFEFPIDVDVAKIQYVDVFFTSKSTDKKIQLVCGDYGIFNRNDVFTQKILGVSSAEMVENVIKFSVSSTTDIDIYGVKVQVYFNDSSEWVYSGNIQYIDTDDIITTKIDKNTIDEVKQALNNLGQNKVQSVVFTRVPLEGDM